MHEDDIRTTNYSRAISLPEQDIKPSPITINIFTLEGKLAYNKGVPFKEMQEGVHYTTRVVPYIEAVKIAPVEDIKHPDRYYQRNGHRYKKQNPMSYRETPSRQ